MREDLRPFWVKRTYLAFREAWIGWFVRPRCAHLGSHATIMAPWYVDISGPNIRIGHSFTAINTASQRVQIGVWGRDVGQGRITLGNACLMSPGSRISASDDIALGDGCMLANGAYITDSDWHGLYDRIERAAEPTPVKLGDNVWVGDHVEEGRPRLLSCQSFVDAMIQHILHMARGEPHPMDMAGFPFKNQLA